jgi:hypothetical protein
MSIIEESEIDAESQRLEEEIQIYRKLIEKAKKKNTELNKPKIPSKAICLSDLPSPNTTKYFPQLTKEDIDSKCKRCADLILRS